MSLGTSEVWGQLEHQAGEETVTVVPRIRMEEVQLMSARVGPLVPAVAAEVPLWVALALKRADAVAIRAPQWMQPEWLSEMLRQERVSESEVLSGYPYHWVEAARLLSEGAANDLPDVQSLLVDILAVRHEKIMRRLQRAEFRGRLHVLAMGPLLSVEVERLRAHLPDALAQLSSLSASTLTSSIAHDSTVHASNSPTSQFSLV